MKGRMRARKRKTLKRRWRGEEMRAFPADTVAQDGEVNLLNFLLYLVFYPSVLLRNPHG